MPIQLATGLVVVGPRGEVVSVEHWCDGAFEREDLESVRRKVELTNDLGAQEAHDVRELRELESRNDLFRDCRAADEVPALEDEHLLPRAREVCGAHQPIVPGPND